MRGNPFIALIKSVIIALFLTFLGLCIGSRLPLSLISTINILLSVIVLFSFFMIIFCSKRNKYSHRRTFPMWCVYLYSLILGICLFPTISYYLNRLGAEIVLIVFMGTLAIVTLLGLYAVIKGTDRIFKIGPILFVGTLVLILMSIFLNFVSNWTTVSILITVGSIIIFSGWIIFDMYRFKKYAHLISNSSELAPYVLDIYIDIINLFLDLLRIVCLFAGDD